MQRHGVYFNDAVANLLKVGIFCWLSSLPLLAWNTPSTRALSSTATDLGACLGMFCASACSTPVYIPQHAQPAMAMCMCSHKPTKCHMAIRYAPLQHGARRQKKAVLSWQWGDSSTLGTCPMLPNRPRKTLGCRPCKAGMNEEAKAVRMRRSPNRCGTEIL